MSVRRSLLTLLLVVAAFLLAPQTAEAHAELLSSQPVAGQRFGTTPGAVVLEFSEPLDPKLSSVTVIDPTGRRFSGGVTTRDEMQVVLGTNAPGIYTVQWTTSVPPMAMS